MLIHISKEGKVATDNTILGYQGELEARTIKFCFDEEPEYQYRIVFDNGIWETPYEIEVINRKIIVGGSLLSDVGAVNCQFVAITPNYETSETAEVVWKSEMFELYVEESIEENPTAIPTYEQAVDKLTEINEAIRKIELSTTDKTYVHNQMTASEVWEITHLLDKYPSVTVTDSAGDEVIGDVHYIDKNTLTVSFSAKFSGMAYCN